MRSPNRTNSMVACNQCRIVCHELRFQTVGNDKRYPPSAVAVCGARAACGITAA